MPVIAESPPLVWGVAAPREPVPPPITPRPPSATPVPGGRSPIVHIPTELVIKHQEFIGAVDSQPSCFKREDITGFTDDEFSQHVQIAMIDKALTQEKDMYCSKQAVQNLSTKLKRFVE
jgi:hypothetical protein